MTLSARRHPYPNASWCPDPPTEPGRYERKPCLDDTYTERVLIHERDGELLVTTLISPHYAQTHVDTPLRLFSEPGWNGGGWREIMVYDAEKLFKKVMRR